MARDYGEMLVLAGELQDYGGYLDTAMRQEMNNLQARFDGARRRFVYEAMRAQPDTAMLREQIESDFVMIELSGRFRPDGLEYARGELLKHIDKQRDRNGLQRFLTRWVPVALTAAVVLAYLYFKFVQFQ